MANKDNPHDNPIVQALIDLRKCDPALTKTLDPLIAKVNNDRKLIQATEREWDGHMYNPKSIRFVQLSILGGLWRLSPNALKVLLLLGCYASQSGLIRVKVPLLAQIAGMSQNTVRDALQALDKCGAVRIAKKAVRHSAAIYKVNEAVINIGKRTQHDFGYDGLPGDYLPNMTAPDNLVLVTESATYTTADGRRIVFNDLQARSAEDAKKAPSDVGTTSQGATRKNKHTKKPDSGQDDQIPGQTNITDYIPDPVDEFPI